MGLFDRFRKKEDSVLPSEVDDYYKSELKNRRGSSVLMALLALIVTLVVAAGLFFGVRAIYRTINDDKPSDTSSQGSENNGAEPETSQNSPETPAGSEGSNSDNSQADGSDSTENENQTGGQSDSDTPAAGDSIPSTGDSTETLPSTGDEGL